MQGHDLKKTLKIKLNGAPEKKRIQREISINSDTKKSDLRNVQIPNVSSTRIYFADFIIHLHNFK